jgi:hypothetical protein
MDTDMRKPLMGGQQRVKTNYIISFIICTLQLMLLQQFKQGLETVNADTWSK